MSAFNEAISHCVARSLLLLLASYTVLLLYDHEQVLCHHCLSVLFGKMEKITAPRAKKLKYININEAHRIVSGHSSAQ